MKKLVAISAVLTVLASSAALAQPDSTSILLQQGLQGMDGGGASSTSSLDQLRTAALAKASLYAIDADHSGTVSKAELAALTDKLFAAADKNRDGQLTEQELTAFAAQMNKTFSYMR